MFGRPDRVAALRRLMSVTAISVAHDVSRCRQIGSGYGSMGADARGRLQQAALELYGERGFEQTTVAEIAERAGLTERTFFRHFADKREVLFSGAGALQELLVSTVAGAPDSPGADRRGRGGPRGRRRLPSRRAASSRDSAKRSSPRARSCRSAS